MLKKQSEAKMKRKKIFRIPRKIWAFLLRLGQKIMSESGEVHKIWFVDYSQLDECSDCKQLRIHIAKSNRKLYKKRLIKEAIKKQYYPSLYHY